VGKRVERDVDQGVDGQVVAHGRLGQQHLEALGRDAERREGAAKMRRGFGIAGAGGFEQQP
jgi:hypothetical protein